MCLRSLTNLACLELRLFAWFRPEQRRHSLEKPTTAGETAAGGDNAPVIGRPLYFLSEATTPMANSDSQNPYPREWRVKYRAAVFETNSPEMMKRLSDAEDAIVNEFRFGTQDLA